MPSNAGWPTPPSLFVSYRRADASAEAGLLAERLGALYGKHRVFMEQRAIDAGENYERARERACFSAQVMLAVIGPNWLAAGAGANRSRLDDDEDPVRLEIQAALNRGIAVLPVLVRGAAMPPVLELPARLRDLVKVPALRFGQDTLDRDLPALKQQLDKVLRGRAPGAARPVRGADRVCVGPVVSPAEHIYIDREADARVLEFAQTGKGTLTLCGPRRSGKSSLLVKAGMQAKDAGRAVGFIDLQKIRIGMSATRFLESLAYLLCEAFAVELSEDAFNARPLDAFLEVVSMLPRNSLLLIDEYDLIYSHGSAELLVDALATGLKTLSRRSEGCSIISGVPVAHDGSFPDAADEERTVSLPHFNSFETRLFFERAGVSLGDADFEKAFDLTGGQPYLVAASARALHDGVAVDRLGDDAVAGRGPLSAHLDGFLRPFRIHTPLAESLRSLLEARPLTGVQRRQLLQLGVTKERRRQLVFASKLYERVLAQPTQRALWTTRQKPA